MRVSGRSAKAIIAAGAAAIQVLGCSKETVVAPSPPAAIRVSVKVAGIYPFDGFEIRVDGSPMTLQRTAGSLVVKGLSPGTHTVSLLSLAQGCQADGSNSTTVETPSGTVTAVEFHVSCFASTGAIAVAVYVSGMDRPLWFQVSTGDSFDSFYRDNVRGNATTILLPFAAGVYKVRLFGIPRYCEPTGELTASVDVKTGNVQVDTAMASFNVDCEPPALGSDTTAEIAFERDGYVMAIGASGGAAVALTDGEKPAWSHDGKLIAFQRVSCEPVCEHDLWLIEPTGDSKRAFVSDNNYNDVEAAFDASATKLAFMRFTLDFDPVYLAVRDVVGGKINIAKVPNDAGAPSWSPDGSQIVLVCDGLTSRGDTDLCVVPADFACSNPFGCDVMQSRLTSSSGNEADPAWSPDGRRIAFTLSCSLAICPPGTTRTEPYLEVIDTATGEDTMLVAGHDAAWSPDGSQLVFVGNASSPGLKVYSFANRSVRHLTDNPLDSSPSWR